jgi:hypothetical protein
MSDCNNTSDCTTPTPACNCPPSPTPPWAREPYRVSTETLTDSGAIDISKPITYLQQSVGGSYTLTLANGTWRGQEKRIFIPDNYLQYEDVEWNLTGTIAGYDSIKFNHEGFSAVLHWDGEAWQITGGNVVIVGNAV